MVDAKVVTKERFDIQLKGRDDSVGVSVKGDEKVMRFVGQE